MTTMTLRLLRSLFAVISVSTTTAIAAAEPEPGNQIAQAPSAFEVVAVSPVPYSDLVRDQILSGQRRPTMTVTDSRMVISYFSLAEVIRRAFGVAAYALSTPHWTEEEHFDIHATIPDGRHREDVPAMLRTLLVQRFALIVHHESRQVPAFVLTVSDKGHRMRQSVGPIVPSSPTTAGGDSNRVSEGDRQLTHTTLNSEDGGRLVFTARPDGGMEIIASNMTMSTLAADLTGVLGRPVFDRTGLTDSYELTLSVTSEDVALMLPSGMRETTGAVRSGSEAVASAPASPASIVNSIERLGLRLESRRMPIDVIVVDQVSKRPTPN
jgi:uncharacterized protein (TIGR03435 family)